MRFIQKIEKKVRKLKGIKKIAIILVISIFLLVIAMLISIDKFSTPNFIISGRGLYKIIFSEVKIIQIRKNPQVYLAKPDNAQELLINFMNERGYYYLEDERMASKLVFENEGSKCYVDFSLNDYYSKWVFSDLIDLTID
jgi:hypothetical protein